MATVADPDGVDLRREGRAVAVPLAHRPQRHPHQDRGVGGLDRRLGDDRELELRRGVLGVELLDDDPLRLERLDHVAAVVRELHETRHAVAGARGDRREVVAVGAGEDPLDLEGGLDLEPAAAERLDLAPQQQPAAARVLLTVLRPALPRRPGPARLRGQDHHPVEVRDDPLVADRALAGRRGGHPVVEAEVVEGGREADPPAGQLRQPAQRHGLDPRDPGVVDERGRHRHHALLGEAEDHRLGPACCARRGRHCPPGASWIDVRLLDPTIGGTTDP